MKKQSSTTSSSSSSADERQARKGQTHETEPSSKHNQEQRVNGELNSQNLSTTIKSANPTVRSLTGLCRDTDVLYVRKEPNYGLNTPINSNLHLHLTGKLNGTQTNLANNTTSLNNVIKNVNECKETSKESNELERRAEQNA